MVICDNPAILFVHIPKTAGMSVIKTLMPEGKRNHSLCLTSSKHETLAEFQERYSEKILSSFHIVAIVRNPLDRFISHYCWLKNKKNRIIEDIHSLDDFADAFKNKTGVGSKIKRTMPQSDYLIVKNKLKATTILKFETLPTSLIDFLSTMGIHKKNMPQENVSVLKKPIPSLYVRKFIAEYYKEDYVRFDYQPNI